MTQDTPTHRVHIRQATMQQIVEWTQLLQAQRAAIVEKVVRIKANNKIARELTVNRSLDRTLARVLRDLQKSQDLLNKCADNLNKCRGLVLELSDGEVLIERTEGVEYGISNAESTGDRGTVSQSTDGPSDHPGAVHVGGTPESAASANPRDGADVRQDAGPTTGNPAEAGHS